jgi:hypothetical protein
VLADPSLFAARFAPPQTWATWTTLFALPMTADDVAIYTQHTGRSLPPTRQAREGWLIVGRRGGKSRVAAL